MKVNNERKRDLFHPGNSQFIADCYHMAHDHYYADDPQVPELVSFLRDIDIHVSLQPYDIMKGRGVGIWSPMFPNFILFRDDANEWPASSIILHELSHVLSIYESRVLPNYVDEVIAHRCIPRFAKILGLDSFKHEAELMESLEHYANYIYVDWTEQHEDIARVITNDRVATLRRIYRRYQAGIPVSYAPQPRQLSISLAQREMGKPMYQTFCALEEHRQNLLTCF